MKNFEKQEESHGAETDLLLKKLRLKSKELDSHEYAVKVLVAGLVALEKENQKITRSLQIVSSKAARLETQNYNLTNEAVSSAQTITQTNLHLENLSSEISAYRSSTSWKITGPARFVVGLHTRAKLKWISSLKSKCLRFVRRYPASKPIILFLLHPLPTLRKELIAFGLANAGIELQSKINPNSGSQTSWNLLANKADVAKWRKQLNKR